MNNEATTTETTGTTATATRKPRGKRVNRGRPEPGKVYQLTGGEGVAAISNGATWAEAEVKSDQDQTAIVETAAARLERERDARVAAARAQIEAEDAAAAANRKPAACGTDGRVPDLRLMSDRAADPAPVEDEPEFAAEDTAEQPAATAAPVKAKRERKAPVKPAAKVTTKKTPVKATKAAKPAGKAAKPAAAPGRPKAPKPDGVPAWQVDAAKTAANPIQGGVVLKLLKKGPLTDDAIRTALGKSHAWTNRTTLSLAHVGLTVRERDGRSIVNRLKK